MTETPAWRIQGSYYETCNCDAICPCRRQNGVAGGRSTYGVCDFLLSWHLAGGNFGDIDLAGLSVCLLGSYDDNEAGSPWRVIVYIGAQATDRQFGALGQIFQGKAGGNMMFLRNILHYVAIRRAHIALDHTAGAETIRIAETVRAQVLRQVAFDGTVSCGIPGHDHPGRENFSSASVKDGPFQWDYQERCGFSTDFSYGT